MKEFVYECASDKSHPTKIYIKPQERAPFCCSCKMVLVSEHEEAVTVEQSDTEFTCATTTG